MTFEEKLAARGRKMDEMKAKLYEAINARKQAHQETREEIEAEIAKLDAAVEEFDAAIDAQIDKKLDEADARIEKNLDKMDAAVEQAEAKLEQNAAKVKAALTLDKDTAESIANEPTGIDEIQLSTAEQVAKAKGDFAAAEENARLIHEYRDSRRDAVKLRTQMKENNAKDKISARKEAIDKAAEEEWILDLLDYAVGCYEMAYAWAMEAEYTLMEAAYEVNYYNERFGKE